GLDPRGVAVHHETDGAGGSKNRDLRIAVAVLSAQGISLVPDIERFTHQRAWNDRGVDHMSVLAMLLDDPKHGLRILRVTGERSERRSHPRALGVGLAVHQSGDRRGVGAAGIRIVSEAA